MKLAQVTLYGDFDIWHFDTRNGFFFQVGRMRFLKQCLQTLPPSPFHSRIPLAASPVLRPLAFSIVLTDQEPETGYIETNSCNHDEGTYKRVAKGIYGLMFSSWSAKWLVFFFPVNRDFIRSDEPWFSKIFLREMRKKYFKIFREPWLWLCLVLFSTVVNDIAWPWQDFVFLLVLLFAEQEVDR